MYMFMYIYIYIYIYYICIIYTEKKTRAVKCNCINKPDCPFPNNAKLRT